MCVCVDNMMWTMSAADRWECIVKVQSSLQTLTPLAPLSVCLCIWGMTLGSRSVRSTVTQLITWANITAEMMMWARAAQPDLTSQKTSKAIVWEEQAQVNTAVKCYWTQSLWYQCAFVRHSLNCFPSERWFPVWDWAQGMWGLNSNKYLQKCARQAKNNTSIT